MSTTDFGSWILRRSKAAELITFGKAVREPRIHDNDYFVERDLTRTAVEA